MVEVINSSVVYQLVCQTFTTFGNLRVNFASFTDDIDCSLAERSHLKNIIQLPPTSQLLAHLSSILCPSSPSLQTQVMIFLFIFFFLSELIFRVMLVLALTTESDSLPFSMITLHSLDCNIRLQDTDGPADSTWIQHTTTLLYTVMENSHRLIGPVDCCPSKGWWVNEIRKAI